MGGNLTKEEIVRVLKGHGGFMESKDSSYYEKLEAKKAELRKKEQGLSKPKSERAIHNLAIDLLSFESIGEIDDDPLEEEDTKEVNISCAPHKGHSDEHILALQQKYDREGLIHQVIRHSTPEVPIEKNCLGQTLCAQAVVQKNLALLKKSIEDGHDYREPDNGGMTPLEMAIILGHKDITDYLIGLN